MNNDNPEAANAPPPDEASKPLQGTSNASCNSTSLLNENSENGHSVGPNIFGPMVATESPNQPSTCHMELTKLLVRFSWALWVLNVIVSQDNAITSFWWGFGVCLLISISNFNLGALQLWRMKRRGIVEFVNQHDTANSTGSNDGHAASNSLPHQQQQRQQQQPRFQTTNDDGSCFHFWPFLLSVWCWLYYFNRHSISVKFNYQSDVLVISIGFLWSTRFLSWALGRLRKGSSQKAVILVLASYLLFAIAGLTVFGHRRNTQVAPIKSLFYSAQEGKYIETGSFYSVLYSGEAYVRNVTLTDPDPNKVYCQTMDWYDVIPVTIDVYFGGSWACPTLPDTECLTTVSSEVRCNVFWIDYNKQNGLWGPWGDDEDDHSNFMKDEDQVAKAATNQDYYDYVERHYHNGRKNTYGDDHGKDDDSYDPYGFDDDDTYDLDSAPASRGAYFNHNTETIMGNCETCQAMSQPTMVRTVNQGCHDTVVMYTFVGALLACLEICAAGLIQWRRAMTSKANDSLEDSAGGERSSSSYALGQWA